MPQISLYVDENTLKKVEKAAKIENKTISKWVASKIKSSLESDWSKEWMNLFGSIKDPSFSEPSELKFNDDSSRSKL
jgi:hypothetical protein